MTVKLQVLIDSIYVLIIILNFCSKLYLFILYYFLNLPTFKCLLKKMHESRIKCVCLQADTLFFLLMFCMFRYSYYKIYTN